MSSDELLFLDVEDVITSTRPSSRSTVALRACVIAGSSNRPSRSRASFSGELVHVGLFAMAAAYLFHIVSNHPVVDGNKRVGMLAAVIFLDVNGISVDHASEALYELTMGVAECRLQKAAVAVELERIAHLKA